MRNLINPSKNGRQISVPTRESRILGEGSQETSTIRAIFNRAYQRTRTRPNRSEFLQADALAFVFTGIPVSTIAEMAEVPYATVATWKHNYEHGKLSNKNATKILTKLNFTLKSEPKWKLNLLK